MHRSLTSPRVVRLSSAALSVFMLTLGACGVEEAPEDTAAANNTTAQETSGGATSDTSMANNGAGETTPNGDTGVTTPAEDRVTYHTDIKPLLNQYCTRCHHAGGQGPIDFTTSDNVVALTDVMLDAIDSGRMPPPVADPSCRDYLSSERMVLTPEARQTLQEWVDAGKPIGEDDGLPARPAPEATLEDADLELTIPEAYTPTYADTDNPNNEYRCFALDPGREETFYVNALHPIVDTPEIVHHVVLAKTKRHKLDSELLSATGKDCINDMSVISDFQSGGGMVAAWAPGMEPVRFENAGIKMLPDDVLILQMHYYSGSAETDGLSDQSGYALKTTDSTANEIIMAPFGDSSFTIPAGAESHRETAEISLPLDFTLWGVFPHMHVLGTSYSMYVGEEGDQACLVDGPNYDFDNQLTYIFKEPVVISRNTPVSFSCTWNNSLSNPDLINRPPTPVRYGERTDEEMCYAFSYISIGRYRE